MSDHLSAEVLTAFVDGELSTGELAAARAHTDRCHECARIAVNEWLLKAAITRAGQRYEASAEFRDHMAGLIASGEAETRKPSRRFSSIRNRQSWPALAGWALAALLIVTLVGWGFIQHRIRDFNTIRGEQSALIAEVCDLHIAMLASSQPPQVVSSDRHTVKPWFQGKLPFSFNIPESLTPGTVLDGANLAYLGDLPVAQLLFSIGRHRASVFIEKNNERSALGSMEASPSGFHVIAIGADNLQIIAVSDVDRDRLAVLADCLKQAQIRP